MAYLRLHKRTHAGRDVQGDGDARKCAGHSNELRLGDFDPGGLRRIGVVLYACKCVVAM